jgi:hypothetical protein
MPCLCRSPTMPCQKGFRTCLSHWIYTVRPHLTHTCHTAPVPCHDNAVLKASAAWARDEQGMAYVNSHRPSRDGMWATCLRSASYGYNAEFHDGCYQKHTITVRIFPSATRTFTKDTALSKNGRERHGMCELTRHDMAGKRHGNGMTCVN